MRKVWILERDKDTGTLHLRAIEVDPPGPDTPRRTIKESVAWLNQAYGPTRKLKRKDEPSQW